MINRKRIIDRFNMGMSIFSYYINFNRICNLHDINIEAESFVSDICRILYGWDLKNANTISFNNSGYDLISEKTRLYPGNFHRQIGEIDTYTEDAGNCNEKRIRFIWIYIIFCDIKA